MRKKQKRARVSARERGGGGEEERALLFVYKLSNRGQRSREHFREEKMKGEKKQWKQDNVK